MASGLLLALSSLMLQRLWGRVLASSVTVMGLGLVVAGWFNAGQYPVIHLVGVVLALVVPAAGLMVSGFRPATAWLATNGRLRAVLGVVALVLCAESRLPDPLIPQGAGQALIVASVLVPLLVEAGRAVRVSR